MLSDAGIPGVYPMPNPRVTGRIKSFSDMFAVTAELRMKYSENV
jgi:hypothetical protein